MRFSVKSKYDQRGFAHHFLMPVLAVVAVVVIGAFVGLRLSRADALNCQSAIVQTNSKSDNNCTQWAQQMVNGALAYMYLNSTPTAAKAINAWSSSRLSSGASFDVTAGKFGIVNNPYGATDVHWVSQIQTDINNNDGEFMRGLGGVSLIPGGKLLTNGVVDAKTWYALCAVTNKINSSGQSGTNNSTSDTGDFMSGGAKRNMWFVRSYMRTAITAASNADAGCPSVKIPSTGTGNGTSSPALGLSAATTASKSASSTANSVKASVSVTITNSSKSSVKINYARYYFTYIQLTDNGALWPVAGASGYTGVSGVQGGEKALGATVSTTIAAGATFSIKNALTPAFAVPAASSLPAYSKEYICGTVAYPSGASTTILNSRSAVGAGSCMLLQSNATATGSSNTTGGPVTSGGGSNNGGGTIGGGGTTFNCTQTYTNPGSGQANNANVALGDGSMHLISNEWSSNKNFSICTDGGDHFRVSASELANNGGAPAAYPALVVGCHWTTTFCTKNNPFPIAVSAMTAGKVTTSYNTTTINSGMWDDAYDIWFNKNAAAASNNNNGDNGAGSLELMVWLNHAGGAGPAGGDNQVGTYSINGTSFKIYYNKAGTISYVTDSLTSISNMDLGALANNAMKYTPMQSSWSLIDVEAGFEVWSGGVGLSANSLSVTKN